MMMCYVKMWKKFKKKKIFYIILYIIYHSKKVK